MYTLSQLFSYAQNDQLDLLKTALSTQQFDIDTQDNFNWTLLMIAAYAGHMTMVEYLLGMGSKWREFSDRKGRNAADLAQLGGHQEVAEFIIKFDRRWEEDSSRVQSTSKEETLQKQKRKCTCHPFYCDTCQIPVRTSHRTNHETSTVHLFSCNHQSSGTLYGISERNRGYQMLLRSGWNPEKGLGSVEQGQRFPVKTILKQDRLGFGSTGRKARITHFSAHDREAVRSNRDKFRREETPKTKRDILRERQRGRQWEIRLRTLMNN